MCLATVACVIALLQSMLTGRHASHAHQSSRVPGATLCVRARASTHPSYGRIEIGHFSLRCGSPRLGGSHLSKSQLCTHACTHGRQVARQFDTYLCVCVCVCVCVRVRACASDRSQKLTDRSANRTWMSALWGVPKTENRCPTRHTKRASERASERAREILSVKVWAAEKQERKREQRSNGAREQETAAWRRSSSP